MKIEFYTQCNADAGYQTDVRFTHDDGEFKTLRLNINLDSANCPLKLDTGGEIIAELMAIRHVLLNDGMLDAYLWTSINLTCSSGVVKKALQNRASSRVANLMAKAVYWALPQVKITVNNREPRWVNEHCVNTQRIQYSELYLSTHIQTASSIGDIKITDHALERFIQYSRTDLAAPFRELRQSISGSLQRIRIPQRVWANKCRRWKGKQANTEYWSEEQSPLVYVFFRHPVTNVKTLMTCYRKLDIHL